MSEGIAESDTNCPEKTIQESSPGRFLQVCRKVQLMLRVSRRMRTCIQSEILDYDSLKINLNQGYKNITFDLDTYRRRKEFRLPETCIKVACKEAFHRTSEDVFVLQKLMRCLSSFRRYDPDTQKEICRYAKYERFTRNRVVIRVGQQPHRVYFVFSGTLSERFPHHNQVKFHDEEVRLLSRGDIFGITDVALQLKRSTTIVCEDITEVLTVDLDEIKDTELYERLQEETWTIIHFLKNKTPLSILSEDTIRRVVATACKRRYGFDRVVEPGVPSTSWVHVLYQGSCDIAKRCSTGNVTGKVRGKLAQLISTEEPLRNCPNLYQYSQAEQTEEQKILTFINSVDNGFKSRVKTVWARRKPLSYQYDPDYRGRISYQPNQCATSFGKEERMSCQKEKLIPTSERYDLPEDTSPRTTHERLIQEGGGQQELPTSLSFSVRHLIPGSVFGMLFLEEEDSKCFLLSKGCTLLTIPASTFSSECPKNLIRDIQMSFSNIPSAAYLCSEYARTLAWKEFAGDFAGCLHPQEHFTTRKLDLWKHFTRSVSVPCNIDVRVNISHKQKEMISGTRYKDHVQLKRQKSKRRVKSSTSVLESKSCGAIDYTRLRHPTTNSAPTQKRFDGTCSVSENLQTPGSTIHNIRLGYRQRPSLTGVRPLLMTLPDRI